MQTKLVYSCSNRVDSLDKIDPLISPPINTEKRLDFEDSDSNDDLNKLEIKIKTGKRNNSKSSIQNTLYIIVHLFNDIAPSVSIKDLSSDYNKIVSSRKTNRINITNQIQHKDTPNRKSVDTSFSSSTNKYDKMATTTETISKDIVDLYLEKYLENI